MAGPDLSNLSACIDDARDAFVLTEELPDVSAGPADVRRAVNRLPRVYRLGFGEPLARARRPRGSEPYWEDAVRAIVQRPHPALRRATAAFEEVVADVYHGFLSDARRARAWRPDSRIHAPLVAWGAGDARDGPYTYPAYPEAGIRAGLVVLPYSHSKRALVGWTLLAHETAGHDIVGAKEKLLQEIATKLSNRGSLRATGFGDYFARYVEETVSDVIGVLNMGPAAAVGFIAYFRGWNDALGLGRRLARRQIGDHHPIEVLRALVVAQTIPLLGFKEADVWHRAVLRLARREYGAWLRVRGKRVGIAKAQEAARVVAATIATRPLDEMGRLTLAGIQNWRDHDEAIAARLRRQIRGDSPLPKRYERKYYASHAVAAGVIESVRGSRPLDVVFERTVEVLRRMRRSSRIF